MTIGELIRQQRKKYDLTLDDVGKQREECRCSDGCLIFLCNSCVVFGLLWRAYYYLKLH